MGMDVEGINPVVVSKEPKRPADLFDESVVSKMECDKYFEDLDEYKRINPGVYFRANVWSWRPLMEAMHESGACYELDTKQWEAMEWNDGAGAPDQATADRMAAKLRVWLDEATFDEDGSWTPQSLSNDATMQVTESGRFINKEEADLSGVKTRSPYCVYKARIEDWIQFLSQCGGFKVW